MLHVPTCGLLRPMTSATCSHLLMIFLTLKMFIFNIHEMLGLKSWLYFFLTHIKLNV